MFIEIDAGFFDRIEGNPIPPDRNFALFTGKLYGCVPMVFVTLIIIRIINMLCHVFAPPFFGYLFRFDVQTRLGIWPFSNSTLSRLFVRSGQTAGKKLKILLRALDHLPESGFNC